MTFPRPDFSAEVMAAASAHAVASYPNESCGIVVNGSYAPCENISQTPEESFLISSEVIANAGSSLQAVIHSHPKGNVSPSSDDIRSQMNVACPYGILACNKNEVLKTAWFGDFLLDEPIIGAPFVHGITDCYTVVRKYFWQVKGVKLPDIPRGADWWNAGENIYVDNFQAVGFRVIDRKDVVEGDCFIGKVRSPVPNHGGVFLDRGLVVHHLDGQLSRREPILKWEKFISYCLRYVGGA